MGRAVLLWVMMIAGGAVAQPAGTPLPGVEDRVDPASPGWRQLAAQFANRQAVAAEFEEARHFPFRTAPVVLRGVVRILGGDGLSLEYTAPEQRIVIVDAAGVLVREAGGQQTPAADPRATAANQALLHILRFDLGALAQAHDVYGRRAGQDWTLELRPRDPAVRRAVGDIFVEGDATTVRRIELRRSAKQFVAIRIGPPRDTTFTPEERRRFFR